MTSSTTDESADERADALKRALAAALAAPERLLWRLGDEERAGAGVLEIAQGGVALVLPDDEALVPAAVWSRWVAVAARRAVETWQKGPGAPEPPPWLAATLKFMDQIPANEAQRQDVFVFAASANTLRCIQSGDRDSAALNALVWSAWGWTYRRAFGDRRCQHAPHTLAADAMAAHRALAARTGGDPDAAAAGERAALYSDLCEAWAQLA